MDQAQCPNCGGYMVEVPRGPLFWLGGCFVWTIVGALILWKMDGQNQVKAFQEGRLAASCRLCGYEFLVHEVPAEPIEPRKDLIETGFQRLEEERRRNRNWD